jgi:cell division transport system permease protein
MILVTLYRIMRFGTQNFLRNVWLSVATISVLILTLVSINMLVVMNVMAKVALTTVKSKIDVSVHFKPEVEESRVQTVKIALLGLPEVKDVEYISAARAMESFTETNKTDDSVIESLGQLSDNPFGATLVVKGHELDGYDKILKTLDEPVFTGLIAGKDFEDRQIMIDRIDSISNRIELFGFGMSGVFGLITLLIILNTIRVSIYTHREEIGIMRLVGASDAFIRGPFYVQAVLWSMVALAVTAAMVYPAIGFAQPFLQRFFGTDEMNLLGFYNANLLQVFGLQFLAVASMSFLTTKMATARYLKV